MQAHHDEWTSPLGRRKYSAVCQKRGITNESQSFRGSVLPAALTSPRVVNKQSIAVRSKGPKQSAKTSSETLDTRWYDIQSCRREKTSLVRDRGVIFRGLKPSWDGNFTRFNDFALVGFEWLPLVTPCARECIAARVARALPRDNGRFPDLNVTHEPLTSSRFHCRIRKPFHDTPVRSPIHLTRPVDPTRRSFFASTRTRVSPRPSKSSSQSSRRTHAPEDNHLATILTSR